MRGSFFWLPLATLTLASPANADWQYTRWGMTPEQVAGASAGTVKVGTGDPRYRLPDADIGAIGDYAIGSNVFKANFYFVSRKLTEIKLVLTGPNLNSDGFKLKRALDGRYGKPFDESDGVMTIVTYHDISNNNRIDLVIIDNGSTVLGYRPLVDKDSTRF